MKRTVETHSVDETVELGRSLAGDLQVGTCVQLTGDLGAGKTALVRGLAAGLGLDDPRMVSSPTYVLMHEYPADVPVYHLDLYRMGEPEIELADLGIEEMLADGVVLIEWAERAERILPPDRWQIDIGILDENSRRFDIRR